MFVDRVLAACDAFRSMTRSMHPDRIFDTLASHPDRKIGAWSGGLTDHGRFRSYSVVDGDAVTPRTATYDGTQQYLYVPANAPAIRDRLQASLNTRPDLKDRVTLVSISPQNLRDHETRLRLRFDAPGLFWVSTESPVTSGTDDAYLVPGGRFGLELYYHDSRINVRGARNTVEHRLAQGDEDRSKEVFGYLRGTANALINQVRDYGKVFNATVTTSAGRSQSPGLTQIIRDTYQAWLAFAIRNPDEQDAARSWLAWAVPYAEQEYETVWMAPPRYDPHTGLSRYLDESPSVSPEEDPAFYAGLTWNADSLRSDAAVREMGWDSTATVVIDGRLQAHRLLPVCLNSLLHRYELDFADFAAILGQPETAVTPWLERAEKRRQRMEAMWDPDRELYVDLVQDPRTGDLHRSENEDLRSFMPLAHQATLDPGRADPMAYRLLDFLRPFGMATTPAATWDRLAHRHPDYVARCQWGHKDIGWPIVQVETSDALRQSGFPSLALHIDYRWCETVLQLVRDHGGVQDNHYYEPQAPIPEKLDVATGSLTGSAEQAGYGNQGIDGTGFRWGYEAFKLSFRRLPEVLQEMLRSEFG